MPERVAGGERSRRAEREGTGRRAGERTREIEGGSSQG